MRILVTGAQGYIGTPLTSMLLERGHEVMGLDTCFYNDGWLYHSEIKLPACTRKDIRQVTEEDLEGFDGVVHLAELSNDPLGQLQPRNTYDINHAGSVNLVKTAKRVGIPRFVYSSSCSVYGVASDEYRSEESETAPQTAYAKCKVLVEQDVARLADDDFSPTFLRNATAYGPSPRMRFDLVLNNLAGLAWTTGKVKLTSDGSPRRPLVHVLDICAAIACVLEAPREVVHNQIFNVGHTRENYRIRDIAGIVADAFPGSRLELGSSDGDARSYLVSFEKIHTRLPTFKAQRDAVAGAKELRAVFERIGMSRELFEFRAYTRVKQLEHLVKTQQIDEDFFWRDSPAGRSDANRNGGAQTRVRVDL